MQLVEPPVSQLIPRGRGRPRKYHLENLRVGEETWLESPVWIGSIMQRVARETGHRLKSRVEKGRRLVWRVS